MNNIDIAKYIRALTGIMLSRGFILGVSTFIAVPFSTFYLFLFYMGKNGFFSYDFLLHGLFAMKLFFLTSLGALAVGAIGLFGILIVIAYFYCNKKRKENLQSDNREHASDKHHADKLTAVEVWIVCGGAGLLALVMWVSVLFSICSKSVDLLWLFFYLGLSAAVAVHLGVALIGKVKHQLMSLATLLFLVIILPLMFPDKAEQLMKIGLRAFGVADKAIVVTNLGGRQLDAKKLLLISPENIYVKGREDSVETIRMASVQSYRVLSLSSWPEQQVDKREQKEGEPVPLTAAPEVVEKTGG